MKHQHLLIIDLTKAEQDQETRERAEQLAKSYPNLRITVLGRPQLKKFFDQTHANINFMVANIPVEYHGVKGLNALYRRLVAKQFTHIADVSPTSCSSYLRIRFNIGRFQVQHKNKHHNIGDVMNRLGFPLKN